MELSIENSSKILIPSIKWEFSYLGTLILCVLEATLPLINNFLGGGDGLVSVQAAGPNVGGFGARFGFPWETFGLSDRSDVERDPKGVGVVGADANDDILPPKEGNKVSLKNLRIFLFMLIYHEYPFYA